MSENYKELVALSVKTLTTIKEIVARILDGDSLEAAEAALLVENEADEALKVLRPVVASEEQKTLN